MASDIALARDRLEFDQGKYASDNVLEQQKLEVERSKSFWSAVAVVVPILAGLFTILAGVWSQRQQAILQFELKAAEIAFAGATAQAVANRGRILKEMFNNRLPQDFLSSIKPDEYGGVKETPEDKKFFLELILKYPERKSEILQLWGQLFPGDEWRNRVQLSSEQSSDDFTLDDATFAAH